MTFHTTNRFILAVAGILFLAGCASAPPSGISTAAPPAAKNLALGKTMSSNGHIFDYVAENAVDGEPLSYFEGPANQFPNLVTMDLGQVFTIQSMVLKLNPKRIWQARTQTLEVLVSTDGKTFQQVVAPAVYQFDPNENGNAVTIVWQGQAQYVRLVCTANSEATAVQIAEWEVLGQ